MKIAVLGTGQVGQTLGSTLIECGHKVTIGSRTSDNHAAVEWANRAGGRNAAFRDAVADSDIVVNATSGMGSLAALDSVGADVLGDRLIIDVSNPLDFSGGFPPTLSVCNTTSLGEQIQEQFPQTRVVKTLNTVNCELMVAPSAIGHDHVIFISGNDEGAKAQALTLLGGLGWLPSQILDLGGIESARATEMYLPLWVRLLQQQGTAEFNISIVRGR